MVHTSIILFSQYSINYIYNSLDHTISRYEKKTITSINQKFDNINRR